MKRLPGSLLCGAALLAAASADTQAQVEASRKEPSILGLWRNPKGTIDVRIDSCRDRLCGVIERASPKAVEDAHEAGVDNLIGTALLENYRASGKGRWTGTVYVPDMGNRFSSHMTMVGTNQLKISGCILGGLICKSQVWTRVQARPSSAAAPSPGA